MFNKSNLSSKIAFGYFILIAILSLQVIVVALVLNKSVKVSGEYVVASEVFAELDDGILSFNYLSSVYIYSKNIEYFDEMVELEKEFTAERVPAAAILANQSRNPDFAELKKGVAQVSAGFAKSMEIFHQIHKNYLNENFDLEEMIENFKNERDAVVEISGDLFYLVAESSTENANRTAGAMRLSILFSIIGLIASFLTAFLFMKIVKNSTINSIDSAIRGIFNDGNQVAAASQGIASAATDIANGASKQAASLHTISQSLHNITSVSKNTAENAKAANDIVQSNVNKANESSDAMTRLQEAVTEIQQSSNQTAKILKDIDEIAFQTNLLALNAAVEAARAGEAGKGFAVVAEEVRSLAQRSAESAKKTAELIESSQQSSARGVDLTKETAEKINGITEASKRIASIVSEITNTAREQAHGIQEINSAVGNLETITQANAASSEELSASSQELNSQTVFMNKEVVKLAGAIGGEAERVKMERQTQTIKIVTPVAKSNTMIAFDDDDGKNW